MAFTNVNLGVEYMRQGAYEKALAKFNRAVKADPKYALTYNMLGILYQLLEDPELAEKNFKQSLKLEADDPSALNNYGQFLCKQDRRIEAEESFLAAAGNPFYATPELAYTNAGSCAYLHEDVEVAEKYFQRGLSVNPEMPLALSQMAQITFERGELAVARDYLNRYLEVASHTPKTLWLGIRIERKFDDLDKLASYSMLLKNKYPDSLEAELFRISDEYSRSAKLAVDEKKTSPAPKKTETRSSSPLASTHSFADNNSGLLSEVDLSLYPVYLEERDLLGPE
ncbi:MAG: type IV pilus biogenesis/stability protein PilW [Gammaproteobacteria bacterium]|nr:type IV pilus biogenesis/stability protein PilW [Gammaproteobacteria bacterium]